MATFKEKFDEYARQIPLIFKNGTDEEVARISVNIDNLKELVSGLRVIHDSNFDLIKIGTMPERGTTVKRMRKLNENAVHIAPPVVVENDPLAGEF